MSTGNYGKILIILLAAIFLLTGCSLPGVSEYKTIRPEEAKKILAGEKKVILLDVRTKWEYDNGHISGAKLIPLDELKKAIDEGILAKKAKIIVYCQTGNRSATAAKMLSESGYSDISDMIGGIEAWKASGFPVEK